MDMQIAASFTSADLAEVRAELNRISTADAVHVDVMDNHFVPNLTYGLPMVEAVVRHSPVPVDCHLMITDPDRWAPAYAEAGAASVTFHAEAVTAPVRLARQLRAAGARAGIALRPATAVTPYLDLLPEFDLVLVMTVEPGFGGQEFLSVCVPKIQQVRAAVQSRGAQVAVQVDGGIKPDTIGICARAGADSFVAGSAIYGAADAEHAIAELRAQAMGGADQGIIT